MKTLSSIPFNRLYSPSHGGISSQVMTALVHLPQTDSILAVNYESSLIVIESGDSTRIIFQSPQRAAIKAIISRRDSDSFALLEVIFNKSWHEGVASLVEFQLKDRSISITRKVPLPETVSDTIEMASLIELSNKNLIVTTSCLQNVYSVGGSDPPQALHIPRNVGQGNNHRCLTAVESSAHPEDGALIVIGFYRECELVLYRLRGNELEELKTIKLDFPPGHLLCIQSQSQQVLLVGPAFNCNNLLKFTHCNDWKSERIQVNQKIHVRSWTVKRDASGRDTNLLIAETNSRSLITYELIL